MCKNFTLKKMMKLWVTITYECYHLIKYGETAIYACCTFWFERLVSCLQELIYLFWKTLYITIGYL